MTFDLFLEQIPELGNTSASQLICFLDTILLTFRKRSLSSLKI